MTIKIKAFQLITAYRKRLLSNSFICSEIEEKQYNYELSVKRKKSKNKIQVYFGKKGIKTVIQGNNSTTEYSELEGIITGNYQLNFPSELDHQYDEYIGTDETGKGDFFGPLVVAGFFTTKSISGALTDMGVRDSKELLDHQINRIAKDIRRQFPDNFSIVSIKPVKYNQLYKEFNNLNKLLNWAHSKVIENILKMHQSENVIIDQFSKSPIDISLKANYSKINFIQIPRAEKHIAVAAASILARHEMNRWFTSKQNEGYNVLKGASAEVEQSAKSVLDKFGHTVLPQLVKLHFKTAKKIFED